MYKKINKFGGVILPFIIFISVLLISSGVNGREVISNLPIDNEYRLKFVDSSDYELGLSSISKVVLPVEVLGAEEVGEFIKLTSYENAVVYAPISCVVIKNNGDELVLKAGKITCNIKEIICGTKAGESLNCGDVVGTLKGNYLLIKVFWGDRKLSLQEIEAMI